MFDDIKQKSGFFSLSEIILFLVIALFLVMLIVLNIIDI